MPFLLSTVAVVSHIGVVLGRVGGHIVSGVGMKLILGGSVVPRWHVLGQFFDHQRYIDMHKVITLVKLSKSA